MENNYPKAYKEVIEIFKYLPKESIKKIPTNIIETFNANMDSNHKFTVDVNRSFEEQNLLEETKAILANIFRDYWATPYQKERIMAKEKYDMQREEEAKREKYNVDVFNNKKNLEKQSEELNDEMSGNLPIEIKQEKFYKKLVNFIKKIFIFKVNIN